jgi:Co/Zn/Cd efflux system component
MDGSSTVTRTQGRIDTWAWGLRRSSPVAHQHDHGHDHSHHHEHGHSHGLVDRSIVRSHDGVKAVATSLGVSGVTALAQAAIFAFSSLGRAVRGPDPQRRDALTAVPLGIAFALRSLRARRSQVSPWSSRSSYSACVALYEAILRFFHPKTSCICGRSRQPAFIGFLGNEIAAQVRLRAGRRLSRPALVADGNHARTDGFVSLGVVVSAALVAIGLPRADPVVGLAITVVIFKITWDSWRLDLDD